MATNIIRSIRKGSAQWSEEDRLQLVSILAKAGYAVKIGEIVEILIRVKDDYGHLDYRRQAVEEACNLLDKLPRMEEAREYEPIQNRMV